MKAPAYEACLWKDWRCPKCGRATDEFDCGYVSHISQFRWWPICTRCETIRFCRRLAIILIFGGVWMAVLLHTWRS